MASPLGLPFKPGVSGLPAKDGVKNYRVVDGKAVKSLFDSGQFSPYPETANVESGSVESIKGASDIHGDSTNDLSVTSIIQYTNDPTRKAMKLDYAHFAYLKKLGVYPNNRLIIARRFPGAVGNDLTTVGGSPMATIVSYLGEENDFLTVTFNEEWEEAAGGFEDILNDIGADVKLSMDQGTKVGSAVKAAFGIVPMPALMEGVQILVREKMGLNGAGQGPGASPYGNPNLIRQAMQRKVIPKGQAGSALTCKFSIEFEVEYEQKFINGVDPTLVYMDIIQNALTFGTSDATFEYSPAFASGATGLIKDLISGDIFAVGKAILAFTESLLNAIGSVITDIVTKIIKGDDDEDDPNAAEQTPEQRKAAEKAKENALIASTIAGIKEGFKITLGTVVSKYKLKLLGVANALTGSNSVPWHVTIGNPKKPFFSSGDMLCESVTLTLGKVLAFNDLPSTIKLSIKMVSGRNLGAQEIFNRFNTGKGRSYKRLLQSVVELDDAVLQDDKKAEVNTKNNEKNNDTQQPAPQGQVSADKTQTTGTTQTTGSQPPSQTIDKNQQTPTNQNNVIDPYTVDFSKDAGQLWGTKPTVPPGKQPLSEADQIAANIAAKKEKEERARQAEEEKAKQSAAVNNDPKTQASNQSTNDPNVVTSAVPAGSTTQNTQPNSSIPGVTQSTGVIQQQQAAGVTGSTPPQPESVPAPPLPEPEPRVSTEPEITIDKDGKTVLVYPPGVTPPDTTTAQAQQTVAEATAQTNQPVPKTTDDVKSEIAKEDKIKAYYAEQTVEDHKRMIDHYTEKIAELDRKIGFEKEDLLDPSLAEDAQELINRFEAERNTLHERLIRHQTELKNKSN